MFNPFKKKSDTDAGKVLRQTAFNTSAAQMGFVADDDFPRVYGVLTDWNIGDNTASILAMKDGTASLYTTSTFGIIGGQGHDNVRQAAGKCTQVAERYYDKAAPVSDYPYPQRGKVNFYILAYEGVRLCVGNEAEIKKGTDPTCPLFFAAQDVLTELRLITEPKIKQD